MNASSWGTAQRLPGSITTSVAMVQEHKMQGEDKLCRAEVQLERAGWRAVWSEATATERGGFSGGVAVLTRTYLDVGYRSIGPVQVCASRLVS